MEVGHAVSLTSASRPIRSGAECVSAGRSEEPLVASHS